jgi:hypothetical protein
MVCCNALYDIMYKTTTICTYISSHIIYCDATLYTNAMICSARLHLIHLIQYNMLGCNVQRHYIIRLQQLKLYYSILLSNKIDVYVIECNTVHYYIILCHNVIVFYRILVHNVILSLYIYENSNYIILHKMLL